jgi:hypothetical protein
VKGFGHLQRLLAGRAGVDLDVGHADHEDLGCLAGLTLAALGVASGDMSTTPLYTLAEVRGPGTGTPLTHTHQIGAVSALIRALMLVVTLNQVRLIMPAHHRGRHRCKAPAAPARTCALECQVPTPLRAHPAKRVPGARFGRLAVRTT